MSPIPSVHDPRLSKMGFEFLASSHQFVKIGIWIFGFTDPRLSKMGFGISGSTNPRV